MKKIVTEIESSGKNIDERTGLSKLKRLIEFGECYIKKKQVKKINKLLNQVSQIFNMPNGIVV